MVRSIDEVQDLAILHIAVTSYVCPQRTLILAFKAYGYVVT